MMSRDPQTLEFCASHGINPGYFLIYPRADAAPRYRKFLADWAGAGHRHPPKIAYCTVVYVDESDQKALDIAMARAARAYEGLLPPPKPGETFEQRVREHSKKFIGRSEPGASDIMANLFDAEYLLKNDLVFVGSPDTVAEKSAPRRKPGCSTFSWASSISRICPKPISCAQSGCSAKRSFRHCKPTNLFEEGSLLRLGQLRMRREPRRIEPMHRKANDCSGDKRKRRPHIQLLHRHADKQSPHQWAND